MQNDIRKDTLKLPLAYKGGTVEFVYLPFFQKVTEARNSVHA